MVPMNLLWYLHTSHSTHIPVLKNTSGSKFPRFPRRSGCLCRGEQSVKGTFYNHSPLRLFHFVSNSGQGAINNDVDREDDDVFVLAQNRLRKISREASSLAVDWAMATRSGERLLTILHRKYLQPISCQRRFHWREPWWRRRCEGNEKNLTLTLLWQGLRWHWNFRRCNLMNYRS